MDAEAYKQSLRADALRKKLELNILAIIEEKLINGQMGVDRAKAIARMVLNKLHPPLTIEQIYQIASSLDDEFTELANAVLPVMYDHQREVEKIVHEHAIKLINSGKFEQASSLMKQSMDSQKAAR